MNVPLSSIYTAFVIWRNCLISWNLEQNDLIDGELHQKYSINNAWKKYRKLAGEHFEKNIVGKIIKNQIMSTPTVIESHVKDFLTKLKPNWIKDFVIYQLNSWKKPNSKNIWKINHIYLEKVKKSSLCKKMYDTDKYIEKNSDETHVAENFVDQYFSVQKNKSIFVSFIKWWQ